MNKNNNTIGLFMAKMGLTVMLSAFCCSQSFGQYAGGPAVLQSASLYNEIEQFGHSVEITVEENFDTHYDCLFLIDGFLENATQQIRLYVDWVNHTVTMPGNQLLYTKSEYGNRWLAKYDVATGAPDFNSPITGTINDNGVITIKDPWAVYYYAYDRMYYEAKGIETVIRPANGKMTAKRASLDYTESYNVVISQNDGKGTLIVSNFGDCGRDVVVNFDANKNVTVPSQVICEGSPGVGINDDWYSIAWDKINGYNGVTSMTVTGTISPSEITLGKWGFFVLNSHSGFLFSDAHISFLSDKDQFLLQEPKPEIYLAVNPNSLSFTAEGGSKSVVAQTNSQLTWSVSESWISCRFGADNSIIITVEANNSTQSRDGSVTFSTDPRAGDVVTSTITIFQDGKTIVDFDYATEGVKYKLHPEDNTATVENIVTTDEENVEIPESVYYDGEKYDVTEIGDEVVNSDGDFYYSSVTFPKTINFCSANAFTKARIKSLIWKSKTKLSDNCFNEVDDKCKNMLLYVDDEGIAPEGFQNTIVNGKIDRLVLHDGYLFYCPQEFSAEEVSFTHVFSMETVINGKQGWETIVLPFNATTFTHSEKGEIVPFAKYDGSGKPFWLYEWTSGGFEKSGSGYMEANKPYLVAMPNSDDYHPEYNLAGAVTFSATNTVVKATKDLDNSAVCDGKQFLPSYSFNDDESLYCLNSVNSNVNHDNDGGYAPGSAFIKGLRFVSPFEGYIKASGEAGSRQVIGIPFAGDANIQGIEEIVGMDAEKNVLDGSFTLSGQRVVSGRVPAGIYIVDGKKRVVR